MRGAIWNERDARKRMAETLPHNEAPLRTDIAVGLRVVHKAVRRHSTAPFHAQRKAALDAVSFEQRADLIHGVWAIGDDLLRMPPCHLLETTAKVSYQICCRTGKSDAASLAQNLLLCCGQAANLLAVGYP